jgi:hypothetical protein
MEKKCLVEGPLNNLQPSMIQFSKPRRPVDREVRFEHAARDVLQTECKLHQLALHFLKIAAQIPSITCDSS